MNDPRGKPLGIRNIEGRSKLDDLVRSLKRS